jgi:hypothetical protein
MIVLFWIANRSAWAVDHSMFDTILRDNVRDAKVDYQNIRDHYRDQLTNYLNRIAQVDVANLPRNEQLALYLNLYNAAMMEAIVERYRPDYQPVEKKSAVFSEEFIHVDGKTISLNTLEHELIRKGFKDPRVHSAMVCGGLSCPPLQPRAFRADDLDAMLDSCMKNWLLNPNFNKIDLEKHKLRLSKIFTWYTDDFGGPDNLPAYVSKFTGLDVRGFEVTFLQYDYRLNDMSGEGR